MINLQQGLNEIYLTLSEDITDIDNNLIFEFRNTGKIVRFTAEDTSNYPERYNKFDIIVNSGDTNILQGSIELDISGLWDYKIYEYNGDIDEDVINDSDYSKLRAVEVGKMRFNNRENERIYNENFINKKIYNK